MVINSLKEANEILRGYVPSVKTIGQHYSLDRMRALMKHVGNPQDSLKVIHVAGTSGKTSTCYYLAALLRATGKKVGLTVSPHIDSVTERVQINGVPLEGAVFCRELDIFLKVLSTYSEDVTYFELLMAFAYWEFARQKVDYAVIETGIGGLLDGSNVASRADKVCVITDIGIDHTQLLGNTTVEIAAQKAGIIHDKNHVFMHQQAKGIMTVIKNYALTKQAPLHVVNELPSLHDLPGYQQRNWSLAGAVFGFIVNRDDLNMPKDEALQKAQQTVVPSRMQVLTQYSKTIVLDGAHNQQKMHTFVDSFAQKFPNQKPAVLLALKADKAYPEVLDEIMPLADSIIFTTFTTSQDLPAQALDPDILAAYCAEKGYKNISSIKDHAAAYRQVIITPNPLVVITGSFYLLSQLRAEEGLL